MWRCGGVQHLAPDVVSEGLAGAHLDIVHAGLLETCLGEPAHVWCSYPWCLVSVCVSYPHLVLAVIVRDGSEGGEKFQRPCT